MSWKYEIDPAYDPRGEVPGQAVVAAAPCDGEGHITGPWQQNPNYRPTVLAQLLKRLPSDRFLLAFGAFLRGESSNVAFRRAFDETEVHVLATEDRESLLVFDEGDGPAYSLYTTLDLLPSDSSPPAVALWGSQLVPLALNCKGLTINRSEYGSLWLPVADVIGT